MTHKTENEIKDIRANIPPVELRDVAKPVDSDDEEAKQDFLLLSVKFTWRKGGALPEATRQKGGDYWTL